MQPIDKFIGFMNWYTDHLDISESIMVYAAMVFANIPNVSPPKKLSQNLLMKCKRCEKSSMGYYIYYNLEYVVL